MTNLRLVVFIYILMFFMDVRSVGQATGDLLFLEVSLTDVVYFAVSLGDGCDGRDKITIKKLTQLFLLSFISKLITYRCFG